MEDNSYLQEFGDDDVLCFEPNKMFKFGKFRGALKSGCINIHRLPSSLVSALNEQQLSVDSSIMHKLLNEGIDGEVLRVGAKSWQKGKVRIKVSLEFYSDEPEIPQPESPLDDLRQMIHKETQP